MSCETFESVNAHVDGLDLATLSPPQGALADAVDPQAILAQLCPIYKAVRPILGLIPSIPFVPAKWGMVVNLFVTAMDAVCP